MQNVCIGSSHMFFMKLTEATSKRSYAMPGRALNLCQNSRYESPWRHNWYLVTQGPIRLSYSMNLLGMRQKEVTPRTGSHNLIQINNSIFPAPTWQLTTVCSSGSRGRTPSHRHAGIENKNKQIKKLSKMNQGNKNSDGHSEKHLVKLCVPVLFCFLPLLCRKEDEDRGWPLTGCSFQGRKWRHDKGRWLCVGQDTNMQSAVTGHQRECTLMRLEIPMVLSWMLTSRDGFSLKEVSDFAVRWHGKETKRTELLAQDTLRKHTLEPVFGLVHWGPPGDDRVQTAEFRKFTHLILSDYVHKRLYLFSTVLKKKNLEMFRYTRENFMSR